MKKTLLKVIYGIQKFTSRESLYTKAIKSLEIDRPLCLIDVGSAKGIPNRWAKIKNLVLAYGFEPDEGARNKLKQNNFLEGGGNIDSPYALSDKKEKIELNILKKPSHSSVLEPNNSFINLYSQRHPEGFEIDYKVTVEASDLDSLEFEAKDFMKIDVQGYELKVLKGSEDSLKEILGLEIEIEFAELYKNQCSFEEIKAFLSKNNLDFTDFTSMTRWERDSSKNTLGLCMGGDALFLRTPEYMFNEYKNDPMKLSAYLSICLIYKRHDLIEITVDLFNIEEDSDYSRFLKINKILRRRLNLADRLSKLSNHFIRFFVSDVDATPMFY
jgi:FkbM family methyltransferase